MSVFGLLYTLAAYGLAVLGINALALCLLFLRFRNRRRTPPPPPAAWPLVTVQLPIFNERYVVERLIDAVCAMDYPRDRLSIQVLDDSTDDTSALARARVEAHRARGIAIAWLRRTHRAEFKAGALAEGLRTAPGEFVAIFDADFAPPPDFLKRTIPYLTADPGVGMVQARWGHLNASTGPLTRAQAMALDGHFVVEQGARSLSGLPLNFNGSAGVWRRTCIEGAGGWRGDTLAEDLDLSYRAQIRGWRLLYVPEVVAPAEIPPFMLAFKRQQFRWAKGSIQALRKLSRPLIASRLPVLSRLAGIIHLCGYFSHPLMIVLLLASLPVMLSREVGHLPIGAMSLAGFGPPLLYTVSQWAVYPDWKKRVAYFPALVLIGTGMALNNTAAVIEALAGRQSEFKRTPKVSVTSGRGPQAAGTSYGLAVDWTTWGEVALGIYAVIAMGLSIDLAPGLAPFLALYAAAFFSVAALSLWQSRRPRTPSAAPKPDEVRPSSPQARPAVRITPALSVPTRSSGRRGESVREAVGR